MSFLLDTNILLRSVEPSHPMYSDTINAIKTIRNRETILYIAPQNLVEFWNVSTRPRDKNGLGYSVEETKKEVNRLKSFFCLLPESPLIHSQWEMLVTNYQVKGVNVHDACLVALMLVYDLTHILTFNIDDFRRYQEITAISPKNFPDDFVNMKP